MQDNGQSCNDCGLPGEPVPGQEDVYTWVTPMPPDEALTVLSASSTRPGGNGLATLPSSVQLLPGIPLPTQPEDPNRCRLFPWDAGMTVVANDSELPLVFGLRIYRQIAQEQKELANTGEFAVVVHMDQKHAIILRGECIGRCTDPLESCRPRYLKASWEDDLRKDLETEESKEAPPSLAEDEPPGTLQFATSVTCECQPKE